MSRAALAEKKQLERFGNARSPLEATDPDFAEMRDRLIWGEVAWHGSLDAKMQELITLVVLTASQTLDGFAPHVGAALQVGATPEEIKEAMYQCAPYIGFPKTEKALRLVNEVFRGKTHPAARGLAEDGNGRRPLHAGRQSAEVHFRSGDRRHAQEHAAEPAASPPRHALGILLWGRVHAEGVGPADPRNPDLLHHQLFGRVREPGQEPCAGQRECGEHERKPDRRADVLPAVYRIPPDTERARVRQRGHPGKLAGARPLPLREAWFPFRIESVPVCVRASL